MRFSKRFHLAAVLLLIAMIGQGCAKINVRTGKNIDELDGILVGQTTRHQILQRYGPPLVIDGRAASALIGENHLAYEERRTTGWYLSLLPTPIGIGIPVLGFLSKESTSDTTIFLFDKDGILVEYEPGEALTETTSGFAILTWLEQEMLTK